jgi:hypothetical protein
MKKKFYSSFYLLKFVFLEALLLDAEPLNPQEIGLKKIQPGHQYWQWFQRIH